MPTIIKPKRSFTATDIPTTSDLVEGEIAVNFADQKFYGRDYSNNIVEVGGAAAINLQQVTASGAETTYDIKLNNSDIIFEGTSDAFETYLTATNPSQDATVTIPNVTGTIITTGNFLTPSGDTIAGEGDALAYGIVFGS